MIELVIVVVIVGVMAAVAMPRFAGSLNMQRGDAAARIVAADLERAASIARHGSEPVTVVFDVGASRYSIAGVVIRDHASTPSERRLSEEFPGVTMAACNFGGAASVTINGYGTPSAGGVVVLGCAGTARTLVLSQATGRVRVFRGVPDANDSTPHVLDGGAGVSLDEETKALLNTLAGVLQNADRSIADAR